MSHCKGESIKKEKNCSNFCKQSARYEYTLLAIYVILLGSPSPSWNGVVLWSSGDQLPALPVLLSYLISGVKERENKDYIPVLISNLMKGNYFFH